MCRNIRVLANFSPPASDNEIRDASLQYVRKLTGITKPTETNIKAFNKAVDEVSIITNSLLKTIVVKGKPKNRELEARKARARNLKRFPKMGL